MRTKTLQFKTTPTLVFWVATSLLVAFFFIYIFLVNTAIVNIVERKQTQIEYQAIAANISELEAEYFELLAQITPEYAQELGFVESTNTVFAVRGSYSGLAQLAE